ncbi:MAG: hypothetical protein JO206_11320, partial [Solirubrobacterales bacterium]|nr:hypothetical protein [Solirubrobacterales bacterium]
GCLLGTLIGGRDRVGVERFNEVRVRAATGIGAEAGRSGQSEPEPAGMR